MEWLLVKTLLSLLAVLGLMAGVIFLMKRYVYGHRRNTTAAVEVELLGSRVLQPKRSVHVLRVLDAVFVVGSSEEGLRTLARIEDDRSRVLLEECLTRGGAGAGRPAPAGTASFAGVFARVLARGTRGGEVLRTEP